MGYQITQKFKYHLGWGINQTKNCNKFYATKTKFGSGYQIIQKCQHHLCWNTNWTQQLYFNCCWYSKQIKHCTCIWVGVPINWEHCTNIVLGIPSKPKIVLTVGLGYQPNDGIVLTFWLVYQSNPTCLGWDTNQIMELY